MLQAASTLHIPVYVTTQNRSRLGDTVTELQPFLSGSNLRANVDKTLFSMITPEIQALLPSPVVTATATSQTDQGGSNVVQAGGPIDAIIVGIETHICVTQTTLDLLSMGHRVYVLVDGVSSINPEERGIALSRLRDAGAIVTTSESILFEILGDAARGEFKTISALVKETKEETKSALGVFAKI